MINQFWVKVMIRLGLLRYVNITTRARLQGQPVHIPLIHGLGTGNLAISENWMTGLMARLLPHRPGMFIDVGVNTGQTLIKLRAVSADTPYLGFEPNPACVYYVRELIRANQYQHCTLVPAAVSDSDGLFPLHYYAAGDLDSSASIIEGFRPQQVYRTEYVACLRWSSMQVLGSHPVSIIKIDVEGAELEVLQSLDELWKTWRPFFIVEILPAYTSENKERIRRQHEIATRVAQADYRLLVIDKTTLGLSEVDAIPVNPPLERCDYVLCPSEHLQAVVK